MIHNIKSIEGIAMGEKKELVDIIIINPIRNFIKRSSSSGMVLFGAAVLALIVANSPLKDWYQSLWDIHFRIGFDSFMIDKDLKHWINDGLMAVFFFVVGLELKREIIAGELSNPRHALMPILAAIGGMAFPAIIYFSINPVGEVSNGWGIPMATDIAFALGVLYLLGDRVPLSLKIFLTALAIVDDIGAVLVIAFFYTSTIDIDSLMMGALFLIVLLVANKIGVRNTLFYAVVGIGGLWMAFLMSGVHATIAAVIAAFTIPSNAKLSGVFFGSRMREKATEFLESYTEGNTVLKHSQVDMLASMDRGIRKTLSPLQRLEYSLHPFVSFVVMPIFAFANAGVTIEGDFGSLLIQPVTLGVIAGLLIGKFIGVAGLTFFLNTLGIIRIPKELNKWHIMGAGCLAGVGFTMSLFITGLAFDYEVYSVQAKLGILIVSLIASVLGYFTIKYANTKQKS